MDAGFRYRTWDIQAFRYLTLHLGIVSSILPVRWPPNTAPSKLPNFETQARDARRELWQHVCHSQGIKSLFLAHHRDDQAETILFRVLRNTKVGTWGLRGMVANSNLVADNLMGVRSNEVVLSDNPTPIRDIIFSSSSGVQQQQHGNNQGLSVYDDLEGQIMISQGLTRLYRPFLLFPKARLISTCQSNNIPFNTDPTNFDQTLTSRNAIRNLFSNFALPRALRKDSMIALGEKAATQKAALKEKTTTLLSETRILFFDLRSSTVRLQFPSASLSIWSSIDLRTAAYYLRELLRIISPIHASRIKVSQIFPSAEALFPHVRPPGDYKQSRSGSQQYPKPDSQVVPFTLGGVLMTPLTHSLLQPSHSQIHAPRTATPKDKEIDGCTYTLTPQPFSKIRAERLIQPLFFPDKSQSVSPSPTESFSFHQASSVADSDTIATDPVLPSLAQIDFDNRFSFSLPIMQTPQRQNLPGGLASMADQSPSGSTTRSSNPSSYLLRPLFLSDIATLPKKWETKLRDAAPGKVRFTLPAVVQVEKGLSLSNDDLQTQLSGQDQRHSRQLQKAELEIVDRERERKEERNGKRDVERVLGLPTLGLWRDGYGEGWTIRYKGLDTELLKKLKWGEIPASCSSSHSATPAATLSAASSDSPSSA
ncbi:MAG: hypothetical protein Q9160_003016 [Pyrenula sp. 1 TL-2023]